MKKIIFGLGALSTIAIPVITTVSCGVRKMKKDMFENIDTSGIDTFNNNGNDGQKIETHQVNTQPTDSHRIDSHPIDTHQIVTHRVDDARMYVGGVTGTTGTPLVAGNLAREIIKNENLDINNIRTISLTNEKRNVLNAYFNSEFSFINDTNQFYNQNKSLVNSNDKISLQELREDNENYYFKFAFKNVTIGDWLNYRSATTNMLNVFEEMNSLPKEKLQEFVRMDINHLLAATKNSYPNIYNMVSKNFVSNDNTPANNLTAIIAYDKSLSSAVKMCISNDNEHFSIDYGKLYQDIKRVNQELLTKLGIDPNNTQNHRPFGVITDKVTEVAQNLEWAAKIDGDRRMFVVRDILNHAP